MHACKHTNCDADPRQKTQGSARRVDNRSSRGPLQKAVQDAEHRAAGPTVLRSKHKHLGWRSPKPASPTTGNKKPNQPTTPTLKARQSQHSWRQQARCTAPSACCGRACLATRLTAAPAFPTLLLQILHRWPVTPVLHTQVQTREKEPLMWAGQAATAPPAGQPWQTAAPFKKHTRTAQPLKPSCLLMYAGSHSTQIRPEA